MASALAVAGDEAPIRFLQSVAHPLRWRLLRALAHSDRTVRELTDLVDEPQNLVSYHLAHLRDAGLVSSHRSSADRRDAYYAIDLTRCRDLLDQTGGALHLGLRTPSRSSSVPLPPRRGGRRRRLRVLFLCTGNGTRSQIAEALLETLAGERVEVASAGSHPKPVHPNAVRVLRERGIDISDRRSKHVGTFQRRRFDLVVTLCDRVREVCPELTGSPDRIHWSIPDPGLEGDTDAATYPAFERTARELEARVHFLLSEIDERAERSTTHG
jgi:protein-tyrosine-phosphatase